jgi:uroporphyrinogen decarboxylase
MNQEAHVMGLILKSKDTMGSRERVRKTFEIEKTDRVTIGYEANPGVHMRLSQALGIPDGDLEKVRLALGVDYRLIRADYTGPELFAAPPDRQVNPLEGSIMRWMPHEGGGYWDYCDFPLAGASDEMFDQFKVPDADLFDYAGALGQARQYDGQYGLYVGGPGMPDVINSNSRIMGMEDMLCHMVFEDEAAMRFIKRRADFHLKYLDRLLDKCRGLIDFVWLGEDLGTQIAPMVSLELYRKALKPVHKTFADLASSYGLPAMFHTCGSSSWAYEDFIEIGVRAVDTLQPEAANMSPKYLVDHFGGRLSFRGCISTAGPLTYGTPQDVDRNCKETMATMMSARGYHFAPTHQIQDNTPVENIIAMYNAAYKYGQY